MGRFILDLLGPGVARDLGPRARVTIGRGHAFLRAGPPPARGTAKDPGPMSTVPPCARGRPICAREDRALSPEKSEE
jgi:hypothetical protein